MKPSEPVVERAKVREVTGIFHSREAIDAAAGDLLLSGFDRADVDVLGSLPEVVERVGFAHVPSEELADIKDTPRQPVTLQDDRIVMEVVVASIVGAAGGVAVGYYVLSAGWSDVAAGVCALVVGLMTASIAFALTARIFKRDVAEGLSTLAAWRGLILWVRVHSPEQEQLAQEILVRHGGQAVRVHEIELEERTDDLPLGSIRPDPWLGNEPLAKP